LGGRSGGELVKKAKTRNQVRHCLTLNKKVIYPVMDCLSPIPASQRLWMGGGWSLATPDV